MLMTYGNIYVAQVAMGADMTSSSRRCARPRNTKAPPSS